MALVPPNSVNSDNESMSTVFLHVDSLRIKFLGSSVPIEKFIAEKSQRYGTTTGWFTAQPLLEFMYAWSGFRVMSQKQSLFQVGSQ